jgi:hypothetical protein
MTVGSGASDGGGAPKQTRATGHGGAGSPVAVAWPDVANSQWEDSRDTLLLWTQIVGKVRLHFEPMVNHWWQVALYVSARGLTTSLMSIGERGLEIEFDFLDDLLLLRTTDGQTRTVALESRSIADFYLAVLSALHEIGVQVEIYPRPMEVAVAIPFDQDEIHRSYDADAVRRYWVLLVQAHRVMTRFRSNFIGKVSPVHYFWGGGDLAVTRFSGRTAPAHPGGVPNCPDWVQREAYSHEVSSCGFWPGGDAGGSFYAYAYPQPDGFLDWPVEPDGAVFDKDLGEFILPYESVRESNDPDGTLLRFFESTYEAAAELARWDRRALEAGPRMMRE